jgi:uncharacterized protein
MMASLGGPPGCVIRPAYRIRRAPFVRVAKGRDTAVVPSNVEVVRAGYEALAGGDAQAVLDLMDPQVEFVNPESAMEGGTRTGTEGVRTAMGAMQEMFEDYSVEAKEFIPLGDEVVVVATERGRGRSSGAPLEQETAHVFTVRGGRITRFRWFHTREEALAAAGAKT